MRDTFYCRSIDAAGLQRYNAGIKSLKERMRTMTTPYRPAPMELDHIELPEELKPLMEDIARNVHETWSAGRMAEGWVWGPEKDSVRKTTPLLVPYEELSESEQDYDRNTALATIRQILAMGYTITKA